MPEMLSGYKAMRYAFLEQNAPQMLAEMEGQGTLEAHLSRIEQDVNERRADLEPLHQKRLGATEDLKASDWGAWVKLCEQAQRSAREQAIREVIEAL